MRVHTEAGYVSFSKLNKEKICYLSRFSLLLRKGKALQRTGPEHSQPPSHQPESP
jgi:hypothetical protein